MWGSAEACVRWGLLREGVGVVVWGESVIRDWAEGAGVREVGSGVERVAGGVGCAVSALRGSQPACLMVQRLCMRACVYARVCVRACKCLCGVQGGTRGWRWYARSS